MAAPITICGRISTSRARRSLGWAWLPLVMAVAAGCTPKVDGTAGAAEAREEPPPPLPFDFKGVAMGADVETARRVFGKELRCQHPSSNGLLCRVIRRDPNGSSTYVSSDDVGFGGIPADFQLIFDTGGRLALLQVTIDSSRFNDAVDLLSRKFGKPASSYRGNVRALWWERSDSSIRALASGARISESKIEYYDAPKRIVERADDLGKQGGGI